MHLKSPPEVLIAGAGPVGLTTALALARRQLPVRIVDQASGPGTFSYGLGIHPEVLEVLARLDVIEPILTFAYRVRRAAIYVDQQRVHTLEFDQLDTPYPFVAALPQSALETILIEALHREKTKVEWSHRLARLQVGADEVSGHIEILAERMMGYATTHLEWMVDKSKTFAVPYLVGADGHGSRTRQLVHIPLVEVAPPKEFAVFEFESEHDLDHEMQIHFSDAGTSVLWPLSGHRCRWSFEVDASSGHVPEREKDREFVQFRDEAFAMLPRSVLDRLLHERVPSFPPPHKPIEWRMRVCFQHRLADYFREGRVCLAGDAVHLTGPVGVQSMNAGLIEGAELAAALHGILREGQAAETLDAWSERSLARWQLLLGLRGPLEADPGADPRLIKVGAELIECIPSIQAQLPALLGSMGFRLPAPQPSPA